MQRDLGQLTPSQRILSESEEFQGERQPEWLFSQIVGHTLALERHSGLFLAFIFLGWAPLPDKNWMPDTARDIVTLKSVLVFVCNSV